MDKLKTLFKTKPLFLYLLPVFFVLHNLVQNFHHSLSPEAIQLVIIYLVAAIILAGISWLLFRDFYKASLFAFLLMAYNFFFGSTYDFLKKQFDTIIFLRFSFIIPATIVLILLLLIFLNRTKANLLRFGFFLNSLLILLLCIEVVNFVPKLSKPKIYRTEDLTKKFLSCGTCANPDIYLIIADEYAGAKELKDIFSFDNSGFENQLRKRGFFVTDSTTSNYNATVYSMASMFSMDYVSNFEKTAINHRDMFICRDIIKENNLVDFLRKRNYSIYNFSPFRFANKDNFIVSNFFASKKELFISQTFISRFMASVGYHFFTNAKKIKLEKDRHLYNNLKIESATRKIATSKNIHPKLVYTHFTLPHFPYYVDSAGKRKPYNEETYSYPMEKADYIQYLLHANKLLLGLIDHIQSSATSNEPPIIILMSDHGYRQFTEKVDQSYYFMNFNAINLPSGNYTGFYKGMSNVNQFRVILNTEFNQKLPLLKDSTSFLIE